MEQNIDPRDARIAELEADRAEAYRRLAYEKLREDQITLQHRMQCNIRAELEAQLSAIGAGGVEPLRKRDCMQQSVDAVYAALPQSALARTSPENVRDVLCALRSAPAADAREVLAWMTPEGDRVVSAVTMATAQKDGGASRSSMQPYSVALVRAACAPSQEHATQLAGGAQEVPSEAEIIALLGDPKFSGITAVREALRRWGAAAPALESSAARDLVQRVIDTARAVADEAKDFGEDFKVESHFMAPLSLALDEYDAALAAAPQAPAAPKPLQVFESPRGKTLAMAFQEGWARCRDAEYVGEEAENDAFNNSATLNHCIAEDQLHLAAPAAPAVDARAKRDAAFEAVRNRLCGLQRYSFVLDDDGVVRRAQDRTGNWIEFDDAHELFDPIAVDAALAAQQAGGKPC